MEKLSNWTSFLPELPADLAQKVPVRIAPNSLEIMKGRHLHKNEQGEVIETPVQMFWRVARAIALEDYKYLSKNQDTSTKKQKNGKLEKKAERLTLVEKTARDFYEIMARQYFCPGSRVLYEAGNTRDATGQLSSCFVLPIEDDLESIFQTLREGAIVQKNNGGTGYNFSHIRPKGDVVGGTPNVAAGPVHFIKTFSQAFDQVLQGKKRGGGNMAILNIDHPDIIEFINLKGVDATIRNFNISVGVTDAFMQAVRDDTEYDLINPRTKKSVKKLRAREVFDLICEKAWECADPGIFFSDTVQNANPTKPLGVIECTNPCGEEPLRAYESCNLGSVVVSNHLKSTKSQEPSSKERGWEIDWEKLRKTVRTATHFLENMIDSSRFPLSKIANEVSSTRKLGLGIVGLGTLLYKMGIAYDSEQGIQITRELQAFIQEEATKESERLATERGVFPGFKGSKWDEMGRKVRNATMTSIAPTGTLSLVVNTSSGIEPYFALVYKKHSFYQDEGKENKQALLFVNEIFEQYAKDHGFYSEDLMEKIADNHGSVKGLAEVPEEAQRIFVTTHDISPEWHVRMQAAAQENVDAAVSKTINLPHDATIHDVRKAYILAWQLKCKGITIYRDGSKTGQVLETVKKDEPDKIQVTLPENTWELSANARHFLERRVLLHKNGQITETPDELWKRIADKVAAAEALYDGKKQAEWAKHFYTVMSRGEFYSGGTFIQAGLGEHAIMTKCLVLPIEDSITGIFDTLRTNIEMLKRGVGTGFNFSPIRSSKSIVSTTGEQAAGPIEYLRIFNRAQDSIRGRGGRMMGSMAILNVNHPDVEEFIVMKDAAAGMSTEMSHYNISVGISDEFMKAVKEDQDWDLVDPHDKKVYKTVRARELFEQMARHAWMSGDPGLFFIDHAEKGNTTPTLGTMTATNPCGEQPLIPYETCNLGNIDIGKFVKDFPFAHRGDFRQVPIAEKLQDWVDWDRLRSVVRIGVRFLDDIIDVNLYPIQSIEEMTKKTRNIGLGIMGFADFLIRLGISYSEPEAMLAAERVMKFIQEESHAYSQELGKEKGNFPAFKESVWATKHNRRYMRNTRTTTIAPTGSVSIVADCNPGIEPVFALGYRRKNSLGGAGDEQIVIDRLFTEVAQARGFYTDTLLQKVASGTPLTQLQNEFSIPQDVVDVFVTTHEIEPTQHVKIQAAFQKHVDSAVSKTINLPNSAKWQDIARVYQLAWELKCKGITVFRDGSKDPALEVGTQGSSSVGSEVESPATEAPPVQPAPTPAVAVATAVPSLTIPSAPVSMPRANLQPRQRPDKVTGTTYEVKTEQGQLYITINDDDQGMAEVFLNIGKSGSFTAGYTEAIGRLISMSLRAGIDPKQIMKQLQGIRTSAPTLNRGMFIYSVPDAIAKVMKKHYDETSKQKSLLPQEVVQQITLPEPAEPEPLPPVVVDQVTVSETVTVIEQAPEPEML